jgi:hypothetical protein
MLSSLRRHLSYANVMATIAVFIALGGSSYAIVQVGSEDIADGSVKSRDIRNRGIAERDVRTNALGARSIREKSLRGVRSARVAAGLTAAASAQFKLRCPEGTVLAASLCFETTTRISSDYRTAMSACSAVNLGNRRLPTHPELQSYFSQGATPASGGEMTATAFESRTQPGTLDVLVMTEQTSFQIASGSVDRPFRCVTNPTNG